MSRISTSCARSRCRSSHRSLDLRERHDEARRAARAGAGRAGHADAAHLGESAVHHPAALGHEPGHEDRAVIRGPRPTIQMSMIAYWKIRRACCGSPGVANVPIWGERLEMLQVQVDPDGSRSKTSLDNVMEPTANALDAGLLHFSDGYIGTGGIIETPNQRLNIAHRPADPRPGRSRRGADPRPRTARSCALTDVADGQARPPAADRRRGHQRRRRADAHRREAAVGQHPRRDRGRRGGHGRDAATVCPASRSTPRSSGRRPSSTTRSTTCPRRLLLGVLLVVVILSLFLFSWRTAFISLITIPLSLLAALLVLYRREMTINTMVLAGLRDRARRGGGRRDRRHREHRETAATSTRRRAHALDRRGSSSTPRSRCAARSCTPRSSRRGAAAGVLPHRPHRSVLPPARHVLRPGGAGVDAGRADGHTGAEPASCFGRSRRDPESPVLRVLKRWLRRAARARWVRRPRRSPRPRSDPPAGLLAVPPSRSGAAARSSRSGTS